MFGDKTSKDDLFTEKVENVWDDPRHKNTIKRYGPPCVKNSEISEWFRKFRNDSES